MLATVEPVTPGFASLSPVQDIRLWRQQSLSNWSGWTRVWKLRLSIQPKQDTRDGRDEISFNTSEPNEIHKTIFVYWLRKKITSHLAERRLFWICTSISSLVNGDVIGESCLAFKTSTEVTKKTAKKVRLLCFACRFNRKIVSNNSTYFLDELLFKSKCVFMLCLS